MRGLSSIFSRARRTARPRLLAAPVAAIVVATGIAQLAACGGADAPETRRTDFEVAANVPAGSPAARHWEWFVKNVRTWSPKFDVRLAAGPAGVDRLGEGRLRVVRADLGELAHVAPELALLELPLLFASDAEADYVLDRHVLPDVQRRLDAHGLALLAWAEGAPRVLYAGAGAPGSEAPQVVTLDAHAAGTGAPTGTSAVLLDGGAAPALVLAAGAWFDALPPRDEDALRMAYATRDARADTRRAARDTLTALASRPSHAVREPTPEERLAWRAALEPQRAAAIAALGPEARSLQAVVERGRAEFAARRAAPATDAAAR